MFPEFRKRGNSQSGTADKVIRLRLDLIGQNLGLINGTVYRSTSNSGLLDLQSDPSRLWIPATVSNNEFEVDERDVEYRRQAGKLWLARIYQPREQNHFRPSSTCTAAIAVVFGVQS